MLLSRPKHYAAGGIPTSEAMDPWYTKAEYRGMVQPEGLVKGMAGGRTDVHNVNVPSGSYVVPADVVSGLAEGNTMAGAEVMDRMMHSLPYGVKGGGSKRGPGPPQERAPAPYKNPSEGVPQMQARGGKSGKDEDPNMARMVPIVVAGGELIYHPHTIQQKFGSLSKGHKTLDAFVKKVRTDTAKTLRKLPGPKQ